MDVDLAFIKGGFDLVRNVIGLARETKEVLPTKEQQITLVNSLDTAERTVQIAKAQIAKGLGFQLCQCIYPPHRVSKKSVVLGNRVP